MLKHLEAFWESQGIDPDEHIGNMWGWKVSYIGLGLLAFLIGLYFFRVTYYPQDIESVPTTQTEEMIQQ